MSLFEKIAKILPGKKPENEKLEQSSIYGSNDTDISTKYSSQSVGKSPVNSMKNDKMQSFQDKTINEQFKEKEIKLQKRVETLKNPQKIKMNELKTEKKEVQIKKEEEKTNNKTYLENNENKNFIETDFDKVVSYIAQHGKASFTQISRDLGLPWNRIEECSNILRNEKQIEIIYLPFGDPIATVVGYSEKNKETDLRRRRVA
jgi:hypothetical protein